MRNKFVYPTFGQMAKKSEITRAKIIKTARVLFLEKGFDGLKMQELADRAEMNKGLLHYYFKSKDVLFGAIFKEAMESLFEGVRETLISDITLEAKLNKLVDVYFDKLHDSPGLPMFVLSEIQKNPTLKGLPAMQEKIPEIVIAMSKTIGQNVDPIRVFHLIFTAISLSVFPFNARPLLVQVLPGGISFEDFIAQRRIYTKKIVSQLIEEL